MPIAADTVQITAGAAPVCGQVGAQQVAIKTAAIETINRGYDRFAVLSGQYQNNVGIVGFTPLTTHSTGSFTAHQYGNNIQGSMSGSSYTSGGQPIVGGSHNKALIVKMFHATDAGAEDAVDARATLGPDWQKIVVDGAPNTCK